jgi:hypothetical protein
MDGGADEKLPKDRQLPIDRHLDLSLGFFYVAFVIPYGQKIAKAKLPTSVSFSFARKRTLFAREPRILCSVFDASSEPITQRITTKWISQTPVPSPEKATGTNSKIKA